MSHEVRLGVDVQQANHILVTDHATSSVIWNLLRGLDDPVIVCIIEWIAGDLLSLRADAAIFVRLWVSVRMRMQEYLRLTMSKCNGIVVSDFCEEKGRISSVIFVLASDFKTCCTPSASTVSGLPMSVSWKAGLIKSSPVPEYASTLK